MIGIAVVILCLRTQEYPLASYKPAGSPRVVKALQPDTVEPGTEYIRGFNPVVVRWKLKKPFDEVVKLLKSDPWGTIQAESKMASKDSLSLTKKVLSDRVLSFQVVRGRIDIRETRAGDQVRFLDPATYTTLTLVEAPKLVGELPNSWPSEAAHAAGLPKTYPGSPFESLSKMPDLITSSMGSTGFDNYRLVWYVKGVSTNLFPKLAAELGKKGWVVHAPDNLGRLRFAPTSRLDGMQEIQLSPFVRKEPDLPVGYCEVVLRWTDPKSPRRLAEWKIKSS